MIRTQRIWVSVVNNSRTVCVTHAIQKRCMSTDAVETKSDAKEALNDTVARVAKGVVEGNRFLYCLPDFLDPCSCAFTRQRPLCLQCLSLGLSGCYSFVS